MVKETGGCIATVDAALSFCERLNSKEMKHVVLCAFLSLSLLPCSVAQAPGSVPLQRETASGNGLKRTRLYLKDGTFQVVLSYTIKGEYVYYLSAERGAQQEIIPVTLVDLDATHQWEQRAQAERDGVPAVQIDPELAKEEADRAARTPEVAKDLHLPESDSVLVLDTYHGQPQLAILQQTDGELNRQTAHNILRQTINPLSHAHQLLQIKGTSAPMQLHVNDPEFYIRMDDDDPTYNGGGAFHVDTDSSRGRKVEAPSPKSDYVIVAVDVRSDVRVVTTFSIGLLGSAKRQADVVETTKTVMPGGHWLKIMPKQPLLMGEYALIEVLDDRTVNTGVWDFGVHPTAEANRDAILPAARRAPVLAPRRSGP